MKKYVSNRVAMNVLEVCRNTLLSWADSGKINYIKTPSGQRKYEIESISNTSIVTKELKTICYARVLAENKKMI